MLEKDVVIRISFDQTNNGGDPPADMLLVPHTAADYQRLVAMLDELIDTVGEAEDHPHAGLMEILGALIESYEDRHVPESEGDPLTTLRLLMADHGLTAADLPGLGDAAQVAATLSGTVALTPTQIRRLAQRFHVAPVTFL